MKTIAFILILAFAAQMTLAERYDTVIYTPEGPVELDELVTIYMKYKHHKYDFAVDEALSLLNTWLENCDGVLAEPSTRRSLIPVFEDLRRGIEDLIADLEDKKNIEKCGFALISNYYMRRLKEFSDKVTDQKVKTLLTNLNAEYSDIVEDPEPDTDYELYKYIKSNPQLKSQVQQLAKFRPTCCRFVNRDSSLVSGGC